MSNNTALPLIKVSIFSSGLAYYEHSGLLADPSVIDLPFKEDLINDALKSLVINDPASANPSVSYQSPETLLRTLKSLKIDLSDDPDMAGILGRLRGAEIEAEAPTPVHGKILGVEQRPRSVSPSGEQVLEPWISLYTDQGIKMLGLGEINSLLFKDEQLSGDLQRALDLIASSRNSDLRDLTISLPGKGSRKVSLSYVIAAPVWKVSYRFDLGGGEGAKPLFQGWAIVDNDSDTDWKAVELSLVAGRPVSFIQNLYQPYYISRPVLPLAIAGAAAAETHDTAYAAPAPQLSRAEKLNVRGMASFAKQSGMDMKMEADGCYEDAISVSGGVMETASGSAAGDQFAFTIKNPVNLDRRMSAMLPLVESAIESRKLLIFSGAAPNHQNRNPRIGAELSNTTGMKLPAGPITVYDGGTYAGDALIEFWNEGEKRLVSFGEDLAVTGMTTSDSYWTSVAFTISGGMLIFNRKQFYTKTYIFKNSSAPEKQLVIEHPKTHGAVLDSPEAEEQTPTAYRFTVTLPSAQCPPENEIKVTIRESQPAMEHISLIELEEDAFLSYASSQEIPPEMQAALQKGAKLRASVSAAEAAVDRAESRKKSLEKDQDRIRKNLEAAGSQTAQGQEYLKRMVSLDNSIDAAAKELEKLNEDVQKMRKIFEDYLNGLNLQVAVK